MDLATVRASPIDGEANLRGRGERGCLLLHVSCAEYLGVDQFNHMDRIRMEHRPSVLPQFRYSLESPERYAPLKWIAVGKAATGVSGSEGKDFWRENDGQAIHFSRRGFNYAGYWRGVRAEVTAEDVRNRPLNKVLAYMNALKERISKLNINTGSLANLPQAINSLVRKGEGSEVRRAARKRVWSPEGEKVAIVKIKEEAIGTHYQLQLYADIHQAKGYEADADEPENLLAERAALRHARSTLRNLRRTRKQAMRWRLSRPKPNEWKKHLVGLRNAAQRAAEPEAESSQAESIVVGTTEAESNEASASEISSIDVNSSENEGGSAESLRFIVPSSTILLIPKLRTETIPSNTSLFLQQHAISVSPSKTDILPNEVLSCLRRSHRLTR